MYVKVDKMYLNTASKKRNTYILINKLLLSDIIMPNQTLYLLMFILIRLNVK